MTSSIHPNAEEVRLSLPWPRRELSPNARVHWTRKARATKAARTEAAWYIHIQGRQQNWHRAALSVVFCPPDARRRDRDNLIASMKAATDGIADALGTDDANFTITYSMGAPVKGGAVQVTIARAA